MTNTSEIELETLYLTTKLPASSLVLLRASSWQPTSAPSFCRRTVRYRSWSLQVLRSASPWFLSPAGKSSSKVRTGPYGSARVRGCVGSEGDASDTLPFKGSGPAAVLLLLTESPYEMTSLKYSKNEQFKTSYTNN